MVMMRPCFQDGAVEVDDGSGGCSSQAAKIEDDSKSTTSEFFQEEYCEENQRRTFRERNNSNKAQHDQLLLFDSDYELDSPLEYTVKLLRGRGYYDENNSSQLQPLEALQTGYYNHPTFAQMASYGPYMNKLVKNGNVFALKEALDCGLSPNAWNPFLINDNSCAGGQEAAKPCSLLHTICQAGNIQQLQVLIKAGAVLQVSDQAGKTPLHSACFGGCNFDVVDTILECDSTMLFMMDKRGYLPFSYIPTKDWNSWKIWLNANIDKYFSQKAASHYRPSVTASMKPNTCPLPRNKTRSSSSKALSVKLMQRVAHGKLTPRKVMQQQVILRKRQQQLFYLEDNTITDYDYSCVVPEVDLD